MALPVITSLQPLLVANKKSTAARRLKYHERPAFIRTESAFDSALDSSLSYDTIAVNAVPSYLSNDVSASYRVVATVARAAERTTLQTRAFSWGYNATDGATAHGDTRSFESIKTVAFFRRMVVRSVSAGDRLSLFLTDTGRVFQTGRLFMMQDGCRMWTPREVRFGNGDTGTPKIVAVAAGHLACYALDDRGRVYAWGAQQYGQLGFESPDTVDSVDKTQDDDHNDDPCDNDSGSEQSTSSPTAVIVERVPTLITGLTDVSIVKICSGNHFAFATSSSGHVYAWGRNNFGQLGTGERTDWPTPKRIEALADFIAVDVAAGDAHAVGVFVARQHVADVVQSSSVDYTVVYTWGRGRHGCLGLGGSESELQPRENRFFRGLSAVHAAAGSDHSLVLCRVAAQTFVYAIGGNAYGQLGIASCVDRVDMPTLVTELAHVRVASIGAGARYSVALTGDGELYAWGDAMFGKTQRRDQRTTFVPWKVESDLGHSPGEPSQRFVTQLSVGAHHTLGLFRIHGEMDRWRKFSIGPIASSLELGEGANASPQCVCAASQSQTSSVFGIFLRCATCALAPICRCCARQCHVHHALEPIPLGRVEQLRRCACGMTTTRTSDPTPLESSNRPTCAFAKREPCIFEDEISSFVSRKRP